MTLELTRAVHDGLVEHARESAPEEVCGVLAGEREAGTAGADGTATTATTASEGGERVDRAVAAHRTRNAADAPRRTYEIAPEELYAVVERVDDAGREVVGFYHSHPRGPPRPSATDVAQATWTDHCYVVVSLSGEPFVDAWRWTGEAFEREGVSLVADG